MSSLDRSGHCIDGIHENNPYFSGSKLSKETGVSNSNTPQVALQAQDALSVRVLCNADGHALKVYAMGNINILCIPEPAMLTHTLLKVHLCAFDNRVCSCREQCLSLCVPTSLGKTWQGL